MSDSRPQTGPPSAAADPEAPSLTTQLAHAEDTTSIDLIAEFSREFDLPNLLSEPQPELSVPEPQPEPQTELATPPAQSYPRTTGTPSNPARVTVTLEQEPEVHRRNHGTRVMIPCSVELSNSPPNHLFPIYTVALQNRAGTKINSRYLGVRNHYQGCFVFMGMPYCNSSVITAAAARRYRDRKCVVTVRSSKICTTTRKNTAVNVTSGHVSGLTPRHIHRELGPVSFESTRYGSIFVQSNVQGTVLKEFRIIVSFCGYEPVN